MQGLNFQSFADPKTFSTTMNTFITQLNDNTRQGLRQAQVLSPDTYDQYEETFRGDFGSDLDGGESRNWGISFATPKFEPAPPKAKARQITPKTKTKAQARNSGTIASPLEFDAAKSKAKSYKVGDIIRTPSGVIKQVKLDNEGRIVYTTLSRGE